MALLVWSGTGVWGLLAYLHVLHPVTGAGLALAATVGVPLALLGGWWTHRTDRHRRPSRRADNAPAEGRVDTESH